MISEKTKKRTAQAAVAVAATTGLLLSEFPNVLMNGEVVEPGNYPATVWIGNCTASIVGPRTIYTAAHCVDNPNSSFIVNGSRYLMKCSVAPEYTRGNSTADYALCHTDKEVAGVPFEVVNSDPQHVKRGDQILQSGFGCTIWGGRIDGELRVGKAEALQTPSGKSNDIVTGQGSVLCSGDSGGPAWSLKPNGDRDRLISVNSRSDTASRSYLSSSATEMGLSFIRAYLAKYDTPICGVSPAARGCRTGIPVVPEKFSLDTDRLSLDVSIAPGAPYTTDRVKKSLQTALDVARKLYVK